MDIEKKRKLWDIISLSLIGLGLTLSAFSIGFSVGKATKQKENNVKNTLQVKKTLQNNSLYEYKSIINNGQYQNLQGAEFTFNLDTLLSFYNSNTFGKVENGYTNIDITLGDQTEQLFNIYDSVSYNYISQGSGIHFILRSNGYTLYVDGLGVVLSEGTWDNIEYDYTKNYIFKYNRGYMECPRMIYANNNTDLSKSTYFLSESNDFKKNNELDIFYSNLLPLNIIDFTFVDNFNLNSLLTSTNESGVFNLNNISIINFNTTYGIIFSSPKSFYCNGYTYDTLKIYATALDNNTYVSYDGKNAVKFQGANTGYAFINMLVYENSYTNKSIMVCSINSIIREGGEAVVLNSYKWINDNYKYIKILDSSFNPATNFFGQNGNSGLSILQTGNNNNIGFITSTTIINSNYNPFTLFTTAFSSLTSLMNIQIIPGLTLGLLFFLPLVVGIIIAIIWIVKR